MTDNPEQVEPTVASASPTGWRLWLTYLMRFHKRVLSVVGLTLLLGFLTASLSLYAFALLAEVIVEQETIQLDNAVLAWLRQFRSPDVDVAAYIASAIGSELVLVLLLLLSGVFLWQRRWGAAVSLILVTTGAQLLNNVLKDTFQRARPAPLLSGIIPAQAFSFPSGHAMVSAAFYAFLMYLGWHIFRGWVRAAWLISMLLIILAVGLSRLYLGVHYFTDVIAGYLAGFLWTQTVIIGGHLLGRWTWRITRRELAPPMTTADSADG